MCGERAASIGTLGVTTPDESVSTGLTTPDILWWPFSGEIVFMTVLGGFRNFAGPIVGALVFNYLKTYAVASTEFWQGLLGFVLIVLVIALPGGIVGALAKLSTRVGFRRRKEALT